MLLGEGGGAGGSVDSNFFLYISSSWVEIEMFESGSFMVGEKTTENLVELEAPLAPAEAEVGAVAKAFRNVLFSGQEISLKQRSPFRKCLG